MEYTEEVVIGLLVSIYLCFSENCVGVNGNENQTFKGACMQTGKIAKFY